MKMFAAVLLTGLVGALAGSLAAQPPAADRNGPPSRGVIYEGPLSVLLVSDLGPEELQSNGRVYDGWVVLDDQRTMIPREQIQRIRFGDAEPPEDFEAGPDGDRPAAPPRRPFRQD